MVFCNYCGTEMPAEAAVCPRCSRESGLALSGASSNTVRTAPTSPTAAPTSGWNFGQVYAWSKILGVALIVLMTVFHVSLKPLLQRRLEIEAVVGLVVGCGLLKK